MEDNSETGVAPYYISKAEGLIQGKSSEELVRLVGDLLQASDIRQAKDGADIDLGILNKTAFLEEAKRIAKLLPSVEEGLKEQGLPIPEEGGKPLRLYGLRNVSVFVVDAVGLHKMNEEVGREAGTQLLREIAQTIKNTLKRTTDVNGRVGGDEIAGFCFNTSKAELAQLIEKSDIGKLVENKKINIVLTEFGPDIDIEKALTEALEKMEEAKKAGPTDEDGRSLGFGVKEL